MDKAKNFLIPPHRKISEEEVKTLLKKYQLESTQKLPKIKLADQGLADIEGIAPGDVVEITRKSFAGETKYYRMVIE